MASILRTSGAPGALMTLILTTALAGEAVWATTWFVDQATGADGNDGSESAPLATVARALEIVTDGDEVRIGPGVYGPSSGETMPLQVQEISLTIEGAGPDLTFLDGEGEVQVMSLGLGNGVRVRLARLAVVNRAWPIGADEFDPRVLFAGDFEADGANDR